MIAAAYDVAVIGFGPVGAVAAALLGRAGLRVLAFDRSPTVFDKPRAVSFDHEVMRVLQGLGLAGQVAPLTAPFSLSEHFGADGQLIRRVGMLPPPYPLGWTPSMAFLQPGLEQILREHVHRLPTVDVRLGLDLVSFDQDEGVVRLAMREGDGTPVRCNARYVIGCDGASSTVRRLIGATLEELGFDEPWLVVDLLVNDTGAAKLPQVSSHFCDPKRPAMFVACTGNHRRFEFMLLPGEDPRDMEREAHVWSLLSPWICPSDADLWRYSCYRFHALLADTWRQGRVFLAGDAAHQQPPFLGQGLCQGVRDVANLCWKLQAVLKGEAPDALLDTYAAERAPHVRELTATVRQIGRVLCELNPVRARDRDARLLAEAGGTVPTLVRQRMMPTLRAGLLAAGHGAARGTVFPQPRVVADGRTALLDDVAGGGWRVVLGDAAFGWQPRTGFPAAVLRVGDTPRRDAWQETERVVADWMAHHGCCAAIVRPDHYVFTATGRADSLDAALAELRARLQPSRAVP